MVDSTFLLYQLQKVDTEINSIDHNCLKLLDEMKDDSLITAAKESISQISNLLTSFQTESNDLQSKINAFRNKSVQYSSSLYGGKIQNSKELSELQSEIATLNRNILDSEDQQMEKWEEIENIKSRLIEAENHFSSVNESHAIRNDILNQSLNNFRKEIDRLTVEKKGILKQLSSTFIDLYEKLYKTKKGTAISQIEDDCCKCCGTTITPSDIQQSKNHSTLTFCKNCGRILYGG